MPRFLYLMRHAQSADKQSGQSDKERELTQKGMRDALIIGRHITAQKINLDLIISSTATRANHTAELVSGTLKLDEDKFQLEDELYEASVRTFLSLINQFDETLNHILCVGHNPVISYLAEYLTKAEIGDMPPAGLAIIQCNVNHWREVKQESCELITMITPANLEHD